MSVVGAIKMVRVKWTMMNIVNDSIFSLTFRAWIEDVECGMLACFSINTFLGGISG